MFRLLSDESEKQSPTRYDSDVCLRWALRTISPRIVANYFDVVICSSMRLEMELVGFVNGVPECLRFGFYNHKGYTYFSCNRRGSNIRMPTRSSPFLLPVRREWIPEYVVGEHPIILTQPTGQLELHNFGCTQFEFDHVSSSNRELAIYARTNSLPSQQVVVVVDFHAAIPEIRCFARGSNENNHCCT